jgi:hypothetical protein
VIHRNTGSGYDETGEAWCLPPAIVELENHEPFSGTLVYGECEEGWYYTLSADLTSDGCLDLVITDDCADDGVGLTHWLVYPGECGE